MAWKNNIKTRDNPDLQSADMLQRLRVALQEGRRIEALEILFGLPSPDVSDPSSGETALHIICEHDDERVFHLHLRRTANPDQVDKQGRNPAHIAAAHNRTVFMEGLKAAGVNLDRKSRDGNGPIHAAACASAVEMVHVLADLGVDLHAANCCGDTAVHLAIDVARCVHTLHALLARGADPDAQNMHGDTPLHIAVESGLSGAVSILHQFHARTGIRNALGLTPDLVLGKSSDDRVIAASDIVLRERWKRTLELSQDDFSHE